MILHAWPCWAEGQQVDARNDGDLAARLGPSATRHILMPRRCEDTLVPDVLCHRATSRLVHDMVSHRLAALEASVLSQRLCLASSYLNRVECVGGQVQFAGNFGEQYACRLLPVWHSGALHCRCYLRRFLAANPG